MPLERRGDEVDDERGAEPGEKEPAFPLQARPPGGPPRVADEDSHKTEEGQKGEQAGLGALLEIHVVDLFDPLEPRPVLQPRVLEGPGPRTGEGTLLPCLPRDPPVVSPGADIQRVEPLADVCSLVRVTKECRVGLPRSTEHVD